MQDWLTVVIKPFIGKQSYGVDGSIVPGSAAGAEVGARVHVATWRDVTFAVQLDGIVPGRGIDSRSALLSDGYGGARLSALATWNFQLGDWPSFIDVGLGYRWYAGDSPDEWHGDVTFGTRPFAHVLLLLQSFNSVSGPGGGVLVTDFRQNKLAASLVYDFGVWSVQGGVLTTIAGVNAPAEQGLLMAVWRRF